MDVGRFVSVTCSVRLVWPFLQLATKPIRELEHVQQRLDLTDEQLRDPETRVSQHVVAELLEEAVLRSGARDLGLIAAGAFDAAHFGIDEYIARSRRSLRDALETSGRFLPLLVDGASYSFHPGAEPYAELQLHGPLGRLDAAYEFALAVGVLRARRITGMDQLAPTEVHFMHGRPASVARHEALFGCPVRFGAPTTRLHVATEHLELPLPRADAALRELLERQAYAMLDHLPSAASHAAQVQALANGAFQESSADRIARLLGMSERTLHRKLAAENTSYRDVIEQTRKRAAFRYLALGQPLEKIAHSLGYASAQSFQRAFRRWTGTTPGAHQRRLRMTAPEHQTG